MLIGLVAILGCMWRPDQLAALTLVPPWCWLVAGLSATCCVWRARLPRLAVALAACWLFFACGWVEELPALARLAASHLPGTGAPPGQPLRIVSLNCAGGERCLADLQLAGADVVLLQEAPGSAALARMTAELFGGEGEFCTAGDVAILARGTIRNQLQDESGTFVGASVRLSEGPEIECVSLRLAPPPSRLDPWTSEFWAEHRQLRQLHRRQLAELMAIIGETEDSSAIIIGGDFNTMPLDAALDELRPQFTDTFARRGIGWGASGTNDWPLFRVDQIWTGARLVPIQTFARKTTHSDHRMVICDAVSRQ
ncbi:MAG: endonuclease/exonuclease/phosphatase family protein [Pirellulaceae bacterium]